MTVLSFGELLLRLASPGYTKLFQKDNLEAPFCGGEANVAVSLANYGIDSQFLTVIPDNAVGIASLNSLRYFGVDVSKTFYSDGRMGLYYLEKGVSQRPSKVIYDRKYSALSQAKPEQFDWKLIFKDVDWFHWTGITPALSDSLVTICEQACMYAKENGIIISCDLNYRKTLWDTDKAQRVMKNLMKYVDVCVANEEDADKMLGIASKNNHIETGVLNKQGYEDVAMNICDNYGCKKVAITLRESFSASRNGWSGMIYDAKTNKAYFSNSYEIDVVDRVGGGDSFTGALIYGMLMKKSDKDIIDFAVAASCLKHSIEGDFNRISVSDVESLLKNGGNGRVQR